MIYRVILLLLVSLYLPVAFGKPVEIPGPPFDPPGPPSTPPGLAKKVIGFTVLHTNDHHGRFWANSDGEYGMAARKTLIDQIIAEVQAEGGDVLLLSGGDINTGVPESDLQDAEPDFIGMELLGYDAMAVGNHEFDNSRDILSWQQTLVSFPFLSANIYDETTDTRVFNSHATFAINGLTIAVIGLTTEDTPIKANPDNMVGLVFKDPKSEAAALIPEIMKEEKPDLVFAVTHMGHYANGNSGNNAPGDVALAEFLDEGMLDLIVGGHSQNPVCVNPDGTYSDFAPGEPCVPDMKNGTYIVQAEDWGKYLGRADFEYLKGELTLTNYTLIPVNLLDEDGNVIGEPIEPNAEVIDILQPYQDAGSELLDVVIASSDGRLEGDRAVVRSQQTNLGRLIATAQSAFIQGAEFGVMNSGGVRASIEAGEIAYREVLTVQPFGNTVAEAKMTGSEVAAYLAQVATQTNVGQNGGYPQFAGVTMTVDCEAQTVEITDLGGRGFNEAETYTFSIPSFSAAGGDGYPVLGDVIDSGFVDAQVLADYMADTLGGVVKVADFEPLGELTFINSLNDQGCELSAP
ncbi:5'-nucleotidase / UDP-sugar diphosphatase [Ferrimonas sediminum]|uniref:5'-nucleotidase / UDP-sugar diphosphatase n=2 Tax=Ferrimonas sediminum TaxID=718193 RepID=A0A1G8Q9D0_9GAMM|nr:5'-nucleotidase / UDP-sugar diphosphatase [Ferrimonas sediminum]